MQKGKKKYSSASISDFAFIQVLNIFLLLDSVLQLSILLLCKSDIPSAASVTHFFLDSSHVCFILRGCIGQEKWVKNGFTAPGMFISRFEVMRVEQKGSASCIAERQGRSFKIEGIGAHIF